MFYLVINSNCVCTEHHLAPAPVMRVPLLFRTKTARPYVMTAVCDWLFVGLRSNQT